MSNIELIRYWLNTAKHDFDIAKSLWRSKKYDACLFFCHLTIEKLLKGLVTKETKAHPPFTHHLLDLIRKTSLVKHLTDEQWTKLADINEFNVAGRYPDVKLLFYKKCTKKYSEPYFTFTKKFVLWLTKYLKTK